MSAGLLGNGLAVSFYAIWLAFRLSGFLLLPQQRSQVEATLVDIDNSIVCRICCDCLHAMAQDWCGDFQG